MNGIPSLPAYLPFAEVAKVAGYDGGELPRLRYWRHLKRIGAASKVGRDRVVRTEVLQREEPGVFRVLYLARVSNVGE